VVSSEASVRLHHTLDGGTRVASANDRDRATASASGDPCAVEAGVRPFPTHQVDQEIGARRSEPARRVARVRSIHQGPEPDSPLLVGRAQQELTERRDAIVLVHRMRRRLSNAVDTFRVDHGHGVCGSSMTCEELLAGHFIGKQMNELALEIRRSDVGEICCRPSQAVRDDAEAHECTRPNRRIVRASDGMTFTGVEAPELDVVGNADGCLKLGRLTQQRKEGISFAEDARHLVHDAAGRARHEVLGLLTQERDIERAERNAERGRHGVHRRGFDRSR
jgi:hypothetical protein